MNIDRLIEQFLETGSVSPTLVASLPDPSIRFALYRQIVKMPVHLFRQLLLRLLEEEIAFRNALWEGSVTDEDDYFEGIYHCAFLLSRCGDPSDTAALWKVQYMNQDIGEIDVGNFVGAGISETLSFLDSTIDDASHEIAEFIRRSTNHPQAAEWLKNWEDRCRESIAGA